MIWKDRLYPVDSIFPVDIIPYYAIGTDRADTRRGFRADYLFAFLNTCITTTQTDCYNQDHMLASIPVRQLQPTAKDSWVAASRLRPGSPHTRHQRCNSSVFVSDSVVGV